MQRARRVLPTATIHISRRDASIAERFLCNRRRSFLLHKKRQSLRELPSIKCLIHVFNMQFGFYGIHVFNMQFCIYDKAREKYLLGAKFSIFLGLCIILDLKSIFSMLAASVPVQAPVPGRGMPTKSSRATNNPLPAFS